VPIAMLYRRCNAPSYNILRSQTYLSQAVSIYYNPILNCILTSYNPTFDFYRSLKLSISNILDIFKELNKLF